MSAFVWRAGTICIASDQSCCVCQSPSCCVEYEHSTALRVYNRFSIPSDEFLILSSLKSLVLSLVIYTLFVVYITFAVWRLVRKQLVIVSSLLLEPESMHTAFSIEKGQSHRDFRMGSRTCRKCLTLRCFVDWTLLHLLEWRALSNSGSVLDIPDLYVAS